MPSALNACTAWPWIVCLHVCDCMFVEITRGPMTSSSRTLPSIRANYCIWGITKRPQHSANTSAAGNLHSQADQHAPCPTWPSMPTTPSRTCEQLHVCAPVPYGLCLEALHSPMICLPWRRWCSEPHLQSKYLSL